MTIPINGIEYVMTVYVDGKPLSITDAATMKKVQDLANQLINDISSKNAEIFNGKTVTGINDQGVFAGKNCIHAFKTPNPIWENLKKEVFALNLPSSSARNIEVKFTCKSSADECSSSKDAAAEKAEEPGRRLTETEKTELEETIDRSLTDDEKKILALGGKEDTLLINS
ncbi:MAG TPA: hypothetical protein PLO43_05210 [Chlamydiales bacterium]|nr:hypothetical protein [Chlamydiales bacterium]